MRILAKILAWLGGIIVLIIALAYIFNVDYLFKGVRVTYLNGHNTAFLADYEYFDNHLVSAGVAQPWSAGQQIPLPDTLKQFHEDVRSVAYMIIHRDSIVVEQYFDGYGPDSKSNSFSMAKSIVAAILGKVIEKGHIKNLDQNVIDFVPEITGEYAENVTFKDLVSMSSGMKWSEDYYSPFSITTQIYFDKNLQKVIRKLPIEQEPGQSFSYQSGDTQLLAIAIQRATGSTLSQLLSDYFWKPMGAEHDALWQVDSKKYGIEKGYCCLASNARDFARFGKLYLNNGNWHGQQLLSADYVQASLTPRFEDSPQYGYSWWLSSFEDKPYFLMDGHLGQYVIVIPEDELIIVRLGHQMDGRSRSNPNSAFYRFIAHAYHLLGDKIQVHETEEIVE